MKGWFVVFMFIIVSIVSIIIALSILVSNMSTSITEAEQISKSTLVNVFDAFDEQNKDAINFFHASSLVPRVNQNIISSFSNNINKILSINTSIEIIDKPVTFQEYQYLQSKVNDDINQIIRIANNYPDLRTNAYFAETRIQLNQSQIKANKFIEEYNLNIGTYNRLASKLPSSIIAGIMKKFELLPFETGEEVQEEIGLDFK